MWPQLSHLKGLGPFKDQGEGELASSKIFGAILVPLSVFIPQTRQPGTTSALPGLYSVEKPRICLGTINDTHMIKHIYIIAFISVEIALL